MKTKYFNRYSFLELLEAATAPDATQEDIDTLGAWCNRYGWDHWNGESFDVSAHGEPSGTRMLYPVEELEPDPDREGDYIITRYSFDRPGQ